MTQDYVALEKRLLALLASLKNDLPREDAAYVQHFVEHAEYGEALLDLAETLADKRINIPAEALSEILALADQMNMRAELPHTISNMKRDS